jgi:hypothetical protein
MTDKHGCRRRLEHCHDNHLTSDAAKQRQLEHRPDGEEDEPQRDFTEDTERDEVLLGKPAKHRRPQRNTDEDVPGHLWNPKHFHEMPCHQRQQEDQSNRGQLVHCAAPSGTTIASRR